MNTYMYTHIWTYLYAGLKSVEVSVVWRHKIKDKSTVKKRDWTEGVSMQVHAAICLFVYKSAHTSMYDYNETVLFRM
jgi:hypothetical protein